MKKKILFVEDDPVDQAAIKRYLEQGKFPHEYDIANSVKEATRRLGLQKYDVVVVDFNLGDGTCFDVFNALEETPFIIVTGGGSEDIAVEAMKCGASDYLVKDMDRGYLTLLPSVINSSIETRETEQTLKMLLAAMGSIPDSVYITDSNANIVYVNSAFTKTYGYGKSEIIGQAGGILAGEKSKEREAESGEEDVTHKRKDGTTFPALLSKSAIKNSRGVETNRITVVHDMSERKKLELALEEAIEKYSLLLDQIENKNFQLEKTKRELEKNIQNFKAAYEKLAAAPM